MAVSAADSNGTQVIRGAPAPSVFKIYAAGLLASAIGVIILTWVFPLTEWRWGVELLPWVLGVGLAGAMPIRTEKGMSLAFDLPVLLAAGYVLGPAPAGIAALLGTVDMDEIRGRGSFWLSLCNRAQTALAAMASSLVFHALGASPGEWPAVGLAAILALLADSAVNYPLVAAGVALFGKVQMSVALRSMRIGKPSLFALEYACFGLLGLLLAETYAAIGLAGLLLFVAPLVLCHQLFRLRQHAVASAVALDDKTRAINSLTMKLVDERRDERQAVAGELHDEVLPPLFKIHLLGQVVKQDLASGRLLDLDQDVPDLVEATDIAQRAVRGVVSSLRRSSLGPSGLREAIGLLASSLENAGSPRFTLDIDVSLDGASEHAQLLAYQLIREAMNNAARHSRGTLIHVRLSGDQESLRAAISDDGLGFSPGSVDGTVHFGLQLMRERVEAAGGRVVVDSRLGQGTCVSGSVPVDA